MKNAMLLGLIACLAALVPFTSIEAQPANDECATAQAIGEGSFPLDNTGSVVEGPTDCDANMGTDVWFLYTATDTGNALIETCNTLGTMDDTVLIVYDGALGCPTAGAACLVSDDDGCVAPNFSSTVQLPVISGETYYVQVGGWNGAVGTSDLNVSLLGAEICDDGIDNDADGAIDCADIDCGGDPVCGTEICDDGIDNDGDAAVDCADLDCIGTPACPSATNDDCVNATPVGEGIFPVDNTISTLDGPIDADANMGTDVWYLYTASETGNAIIQTCETLGTLDDSVIIVYDGASGCPIAGSPFLGSDDDGCVNPAFSSIVNIPVFAGDTYYVQVGGWNGAVGTSDLDISIAAPEICDDGLDNDFDGAIDCADTDCVGFPTCGAEVCDDGLDNDGDGLIDCLDLTDCLGTPTCPAASNDECITSTEIFIAGPGIYTAAMDSTTASTGLDPLPTVPCTVLGQMDNDIWYSFTPDVDMSVELHTCDPLGWDTDLALYEGADCALLTELACDGDGVGLVGCQGFYSYITFVPVFAGVEYKVRVGSWAAGASGTGLLTLNAVVPGVEDCLNGLDDDVDGLTDCADPDCFAEPNCSEALNCFDGIDNDVDGLIDCLDDDCASDPGCTEICDDGLDNDGDGLVDCADNTCACTAACPVPLDADECCSALPVTDGANAFDTTLLSDSGNNINNCGGGFGAMSNDGWFSYTATADGSLFWDTCDAASFDTDVNVYTGSCDALIDVDCNGDGVGLVGCQAFYSAGGFQVLSGESYLIRIGGFGAGTAGLGTLNISVTCADLITGFAGANDCSTNDVTLTWDPAGYDTFDVSRDGVVLATGLPAGTVSYVDSSGLANGTYNYEVSGICNSGGGDTQQTNVSVACSSGGETDLIINTDPGLGLVDSAGALEAALTANGIAFLTVPDAPATVLGSVIGSYERVWVMTGTFGSDGRLTSADSDALGSWIEAGIGVYLEGGDHWGFAVAAGNFDNYDGVIGAADGDDTFLAMNGLDTLIGTDWSDLIGVPYTQDQAGNDWTDQLTVGPEFGGPDVGAIWQEVAGTYTTGALSLNQDLGGSPIGVALVQSWEFGGFGGDQTDLAARMVAALGGGGGGPVGPNFGRGDCNADGGFNIADAIFVLAALFSGGPSGTCLDACDSNDDGGVNIADAIFSLAALFSGGPPPSAPAPGTCGLDATDTDALDCVSFPPCP